MKTWRARSSPLVLLLVAGVLAWGGTATPPASEAAPPASAPAASSRGPSPALSPVTLVVPVAGVVDGPPERVSFSGRVQIRSRLVLDPDFGAPAAVALSIDFLAVSGVGLTTGLAYDSPAEEELLRTLVESDVLELPFAFFPRRARGILSARSGLVSLELAFDPATGKLTAASAAISTPDFD